MIRILNKNVADKIAAGEVVERPLSIVKELVENSIDAKSSKIVLEIKDGGKSYIRVTDDGIGISQDECELAFERHATSKIENENDLNSIETLGFRGEALASIAAVSRIELLTKTLKNNIGKKVTIHGGALVESSIYGCPNGTTIVVHDLFYNTPARLKFLKSSKSESSLIIDFITQVALAYPDIKVMLINNGTILFSTNGKGNRLNTIATLTSKIHSDKLIPFEYTEECVTVEGYVSGIGESRKSRKNQIFFINGRVINSKIIEKGISKAYSERLFDGRFPICYLFLTIDPKNLDVNIHPNKREVRFFNEELITSVVKNGILSALNSEDAIPDIKKNEKTFTFREPSHIEKKADQKCDENNVDIKNILSTYNTKVQETQMIITNEKNTIYEDKTVSSFNFEELSIVGQFFNTYVQLKSEDAIYFIDQHAAHERVFYEKILKQYREEEKIKQQLMIPIIFEISHGEKELEEQWLDPLCNMGFSLEEFGQLTYRVIEIPIFFKLSEAEEFLKGYIDNIGDYKNFIHEKAINNIAMKACKSAVKANDRLSKEEIKELLKDMKNCINPFSCPHGRPTFVKITKSDMEKNFKRK